MEPVKSAQKIEVIATDWAVRSDRGLSHSEELALEHWLLENPRHAGAYARALTVMAHTDRAAALGPHFDPHLFCAQKVPSPPQAQASQTRRRFLLGGVAASVAVGVGVGTYVLSAGETYATARGDMRVISLPDGTIVTLNTQTQVFVSYSSSARHLRVDHGEVFLEIPNEPRPFIVDTTELTITANNTGILTVKRLDAAPTEVTVQSGEVIISQENATAKVALQPKMRVVADKAAELSIDRVSQENVTRQTAWRDGMIAFEGSTLGEASKEFQRYSDLTIRFENERLAERKVTGLFNARDPKGFAATVATSFGLRARVQSGEIILYQ